MFARSAETSAHQMTTFTTVSASATYTSFCQRSMASLMLSIAFWVQADSVMMLDPVGLGNSAPLPLANRPSVGRVKKHSWLLMRSSRGALPRRRTGGRAYQRIVRELRCADGRLSVL